MIDVHKNKLLGYIANPYPERIATDFQRYNTKANLTTRNMQTLPFPKVVTEDTDHVNRRNSAQHFNNSFLATMWAAIYMAYQIDADLVYGVVYAITYIHTIDNVRVIAEGPVGEPRTLFPYQITILSSQISHLDLLAWKSSISLWILGT